MFDLPETIRAFSNELRKRAPHQQLVLALVNPRDVTQMMTEYAVYRESLMEPNRIIGVNINITDLVAPGQVQFLIFRNPGWGVDCNV